MASIFDDLFSIFRDNQDIIKTGAGIYDFFQDRKQGDRLQNYEQNIPAIDPFGSGNRSIYQNQLAQLYSNPNYIENLPGYKFARSQGEKGIDRAAARKGQFYSGNTLYELSNFNQDLAGQFYDEEMERLLQLSGANFAPNAGSASEAYQKGLALDANSAGNILAGAKQGSSQGTLDALSNILSGGKTVADAVQGEGLLGQIQKLFGGGGNSIPGSGAVSGLTNVLGSASSFGMGAGVPGGGAALASGAGSLGAGAAGAGGFSFGGGTSLAGMESLFGSGFGVNAGATGGATAASGAGSGALAGSLGTMLGAAAPLALVAFGMSRSGKRKAKQAAQMAPYLDQIRNTAETNINIPGQGEVLGRLFNDPTTGSQYAVTGDINQGGNRSAAMTDLSTGKKGVWAPYGGGYNIVDGNLVGGGNFSSIEGMTAFRDRQNMLEEQGA